MLVFVFSGLSQVVLGLFIQNSTLLHIYDTRNRPDFPEQKWKIKNFGIFVTFDVKYFYENEENLNKKKVNKIIIILSLKENQSNLKENTFSFRWNRVSGKSVLRTNKQLQSK